jgi:cytochrome c peroxidase
MLEHGWMSIATVMGTLTIAGACAVEPTIGESEEALLLEEVFDEIPNNVWLPNAAGFAATYSTQGLVDLSGEFFQAQGTNGRHCGSCHAVEDGWSVRPETVELVFSLTGGTHPIFNRLDADRPDADLSTVQSRREAFTMLRQGKFTRRVTPPATRDYDVIAASDPFGVGTTESLWFFRRPLATADFRSHSVMWDGANTVGNVLRDGLIRQARGNVTGAQEGQPAPDEVIFDIVDYEMALSHAQTFVWGVGSLTAAGGRGGPELAAAQPLLNGRFDLYDAWATSNHRGRRQIWRGQEVFNNVNPPSGRTCRGCHSAANNGQNVNGTLFDVRTSEPHVASPDMAVYTFEERATGEVVESTDPGRGIRNGLFADLNKFKPPSLRGLSSRAPYFHNGIAATLRDVVEHYEAELGFVFTAQERDDLVAFMKAL